MMNQEDIELIEGYINNVISQEQRQEVEQRMATDEGFREEVEFQRKMHKHFQDEGWHRFRGMVQGVMDDNPVSQEMPQSAPPGKTKPSILLWVGLLAILLITGFFIWQWSRQAKPTPIDSKIQPIETPPRKDPENKLDEIAPEPTLPTQKPTVPPPLAAIDPANFVPNASMEAFVEGERMSGGLDLTIASPHNGATFLLDKKGATDLYFAGTVEGIDEDESTTYSLSLYNNRMINKPLFSLPFDLRKAAAGKLKFELRHRLKAPPGLYYFTLENQAGEREYTGRFFIGRPNK